MFRLRPVITAVCLPKLRIKSSKRTNILELATTIHSSHHRWSRYAPCYGICWLSAVMINFSLNPGTPNQVTLRYHLPIGILFSWSIYVRRLLLVIASFLALLVGVLNYFKTVRLYGERRAVVQVGFKTQSVAVVLGCFIISVAILFIATKATPEGS